MVEDKVWCWWKISAVAKVRRDASDLYPRGTGARGTVVCHRVFGPWV